MKSIVTGALVGITLLISGCSSQKNITDPNPQQTTPDHSGMWLMPQLSGDLHGRLSDIGLKLSPEAIYNPNSPSLENAVTRINIGDSGGGTGSFVSPTGLILTNHHVAYDGIASAGDTDRNFLESGFYAASPDDEIPLEGYSIHIPILQKDVTDQFRERVDSSASFQQRLQQREQIRYELIEKYQNNDSDLLVEVDEVLSGNRMILSIYRIIRDVRLVYAPEESVGKFGGDIDNWMWPRHTGDYAFLRAYISEEGRGEPYQPTNVPFQPEKYLAVKKGELSQGDFIMTLGFPGSTYRMESSYAFDYYEKHQFPVLESAFSAYLKGLDITAEADRGAANQIAAERASIANTLKYFQGVRDGFKRHQITPKKSRFDQQFQEWAEADSVRNLRYGRVLSQLEQSYNIAGQTGDVLYLTFYALQFSNTMQMASMFTELTSESAELTDQDKLMIFDNLRQSLSLSNPDAEKAVLTDLLKAFADLPKEKRPLVFYRFFDTEDSEELKSELVSFTDRRFSNSILSDTSQARKLLFEDANPSETAQKDSLFVIASDIHDMLDQSRENYVRHFTYLQPAQERYVEGVVNMQGERPYRADANFTLRLSAGKVMGYSPEDGVQKLPVTTFAGMIAKHRGETPFNLPEELLNYYSGRSASGSMAVNFLSTNDITGGNSGSPALNENGELVGLVFDGNIEGIASDYYFIPEMTRTLSVDIDFILFMMEEIDHTERLLDEMDIQSN